MRRHTSLATTLALAATMTSFCCTGNLGNTPKSIQQSQNGALEEAVSALTDDAREILTHYNVQYVPNGGNSCDNIRGIIRIDPVLLELMKQLGETERGLTVHEMAHAWWGAENIVWGVDYAFGRFVQKPAGMLPQEKKVFKSDFDMYMHDNRLTDEEAQVRNFVAFQVRDTKEAVWPSEFHLDRFIYNNPIYPEGYSVLASRVVEDSSVPKYMKRHFGRMLRTCEVSR
ncbi:MAG: hypothetical protein ABIA93_00010 [Candidatus Woesearchaeota archaeon]